MRLGPLIEVILYVRDMATQVAFYRDTLGLDVSYPHDRDSYADEMWVTLATGDCTLALHGGATGVPGPAAPTIVFQVDDIHAAREALIERGVPMGEIRSAAPGILVCDARDPEGNRFSIESRT